VNNLTKIIIDGIANADLESAELSRIYGGEEGKTKNQFLFFTKPELVRGLRRENVEAIYSFLTDAIAGAGMSMQSAVLLTGRYMKKHDIVSSHYGVIDKATRNPLAFFSDKANESFRGFFGRSLNDSDVLGGFAYMDRFGISAEELTGLWLAKEFRKLASGMYCARIEENDTFLVNGFYPRMLLHFTKDDSIVVGLALGTDMSWKDMRNVFLGATDPAKARERSIRRMLLEGKERFGLDAVSANFNGVHASAGPVEALVELLRFTQVAGASAAFSGIRNFDFGRNLVARFREQTVFAILSNMQCVFDGKRTSVFDLTEEQDSDAALELLSGAEF
jgi:hypothetical protein